MNSSGIPSRTSTIFAASGEYNSIAEASTAATLSNGTVTMDVGYPPLTMTPISSGGIPPQGEDTNGIFNRIFTKLQWSDAGGGYPFNSSFASSIGGYPKGAIIPASDFSGDWLNTLDANTTNPEGTGASITGWVPSSFGGISTISGLSSASQNVSCLKAANKVLILTGALTSNIYLYFPAWSYSWTVINNCSGSFSVFIKTPNGSSYVTSSPGASVRLYGDGTDILPYPSDSASPTGMVAPFAMKNVPTGWLWCDGRAVSRTTYSALYAALGTTWGAGDGSTTFNLPDLRGDFVRGWDNGRGLDTNRVFASQQQSQNASHDHPLTMNPVAGHDHPLTMNPVPDHVHGSGTEVTVTAGTGTTIRPDGGTGVKTSAAGGHTPTGTVGSGGAYTPSGTVGLTGGNESRPHNVAMLYCIKF